MLVSRIYVVIAIVFFFVVFLLLAFVTPRSSSDGGTLSSRIEMACRERRSPSTFFSGNKSGLKFKRELCGSLAKLGSDYGGWVMCTAGLTPHSIVYSFGIGEDNSWEARLLKDFNPLIFAFDPTPKSLMFSLASPLAKNPKYHIISLGLAP